MGESPTLQLTKRQFLKLCGTGVCLLAGTSLGLPMAPQAQTAKKGLIKAKISPFFTPLEGGAVQCELCPRRCRVALGDRGFCKVRENRNGKYYTLVYGNPCALQLDPMEKKPFLHVLPGTRVLSVATAGCNFHCKFCQNWEISQAFPEDVFCYDVPPKALAKRAKGMGARSIAYTYVEPTVFYEYMYDACRSAKASGLLNMIHSNGFINPEPLQRLCKFLDAAQIDLKGFTEDFYDDLCVGKLEPVLGTLKVLKQNNVHLEITNLVIPTKNDSMAIIRSMCRWIITHLGPETPLHFSRFYPLYRLRKLPPTPIALLQEAHETARSCGLKYVYIGNVPGHSAWNTSCPGCSRIIIHRIGYVIRETHMDKGNCAFCGYPIPGIWT